jgi:LPXTG-motif cell wall-anchored protein
MGLLLALVVGGIIGWLASIVMRTDAHQGTPLSIVIGIVGALLGGFVLGPILGGGNLLESELDIRTLPVTMLGAILLLLAVSFFRRRRRR